MTEGITKSDRRGLRGPTVRWCVCAEPRFDHHRTAAFTFTEWCCACRMPSQADHARMEWALHARVLKVQAIVCAMEPAAIGWRADQHFIRQALREGVPAHTVVRMVAESNRYFRSEPGWTRHDKGAIARLDGFAFGCLTRWANGQPWSPWLWVSIAVREGGLDIGAVGRVDVGVIVVPESLTLDAHVEHPEVGNGVNGSDDGEMLVLVPAPTEPLMSLRTHVENLRGTYLNRVVVVCTADVADRLQRELRSVPTNHELARRACARADEAAAPRSTTIVNNLTIGFHEYELPEATPSNSVALSVEGARLMKTVMGMVMGMAAFGTAAQAVGEKLETAVRGMVVSAHTGKAYRANRVNRVVACGCSDLGLCVSHSREALGIANPEPPPLLSNGSTHQALVVRGHFLGQAEETVYGQREDMAQETPAHVGVTLSPAYAHAPGSLDAYPVGQAHEERVEQGDVTRRDALVS